MYYCNMRKGLWLFSFCLLTVSLWCQKGTHKGQLSVGAGAVSPVGRFAGSHTVGGELMAGTAGAWSAFYKQKQVRFAWSGGAAFFIGKKEMVSGYPYSYPGYVMINAMAGAMYSPVRKTTFMVLAGPGARFYNGISAFAISSRFDIQYYVDKKWAVSPGINMQKEAGAGPSWSLSLKAILSL